MGIFAAKKTRGQRFGLLLSGGSVQKLSAKAAGAVVQAGATRLVPVSDTLVAKHFIGFTFVSDTAWTLAVGIDQTGVGIIVRRALADRFTFYLGDPTQASSRWTTISAGNYVQWPAPVAGDRIELRTLDPGKGVGLYRNDILVLALAPNTGVSFGLNGSNVYFSQPGGNVPTGVSYGGFATPILVSAARLDSQLRVELDIDYTNANNIPSDVPNIQLFLSDGVTPVGPKVKATLLGNLTPGKATVRSIANYTSDQFGTKPVIKLYEVVNGVETGFVSGAVTVTMAGAPFRLGVNFAPYSGVNTFSSANDLWIAGRWIAGTDTFDANGKLTMSSVGVARRRISNPLVAGTEVEFSWTQADPASPDATWNSNNTVGNLIPLAPANGRRRLKYVSAIAQVEGQAAAESQLTLVSGTAGSLPDDMKLYAAGADRTKFLTPQRRDLNALFYVTRFMDQSNVNGNAAYPGTIMGWADRAFAGNLDEMCMISNETDTDFYYTIPIYWQDDFYLNVLPYIDARLKPNLKIWIEWSNELTNVLLAGGITYNCIKAWMTQRTGEAYKGDGGGGLEQICKEAAIENKRVFDLMRPTLPNSVSRVVFVMSAYRNNLQYGIAKANDFTNYDFVCASAPYIYMGRSTGIAKNTYFADQTPAALKPILMADIDSAVDGMIPFRDIVRFDGKRLGSYEVGVDWNDNHVSVENIAIFKRSVEYYDCHYYLFSRLRAEFGDMWAYYFDVGYFTTQYSWAMKETDNATTQRAIDAWLAIKALG